MDKSLCSIGDPLRTVLSAINEEPAGIAFVVDAQSKLAGVITDGDFRRMLLDGIGLDQQLGTDRLGEFVSAQSGEKLETILAKTNKKVRIIPILDEDGKPIDYFRYDHRVKMMPVAEPSLKGNEFNYLNDAFLSTWISSAGAYINRFEADFSDYCQVAHGVAVMNGTVALQLALTAMGVGPGDEVIIPDLTFAATINSVIHVGATPVIVDVEMNSWCIDPDAIKAAITNKTKAIIPVHVYGQPCDMDAIMQIAEEHNLLVLEDAAEAHGATCNGRKVGSFGHAATFSFFGNKIITTGEGGMVVTNDPELDARMRVLRDHGMNKEKRYWHDHVGFNFRMTNLQAAIGCGQLERIDEILLQRKRLEERYRDVLSKIDFLSWAQDLTDRSRVIWLVCAICNGVERDSVMNTLRENGVDVRPFFYTLSEMPIYKEFAREECPNAALLSKIGLNLPTIERVDFEIIERAFKAIRS